MKAYIQICIVLLMVLLVLTAFKMFRGRFVAENLHDYGYSIQEDRFVGEDIEWVYHAFGECTPERHPPGSTLGFALKDFRRLKSNEEAISCRYSLKNGQMVLWFMKDTNNCYRVIKDFFVRKGVVL